MRFDARTIAVAAATLVACSVLVAARALDLPPLAAAAKLAASCGFIAVALFSGAKRSRYGRILLAGLVLSWFGDMFLLGESQQLFMAGLVSFLLAHVAYILGFSTYGLSNRWSYAALAPVVIVSMAFLLWLTPSVPTDMILPVRVYTLVISLMLVLAFGARGVGAPVLVPLGAALFYFSDVSVATLQFTSTTFPHYVWGLPFYYTGQLMLALSVSFVQQKGQTE